MAGIYLEGSSKPLSGVYTLIQAAVAAVTMSNRGIVAYAFTSDWGPVNVITPTANGSEFKAVFNGAKTALSAAKVYTHAYKGNPQRVLGYRMATGLAAKGTLVLSDAAAAMALTLETLYPSKRVFTAVVKDGTSGGKVVDIVENGIKLVSVEGTTVADLEAALNLSDYVRVTAKGTTLPNSIAGANFVGGSDGEIVTATEYNAFLEELEADGTPSTFALDGTSDETIIASVATWVKRVRLEGLYITFVNGGPATWDTALADANTASISFNYRGIVNVGNGVDGYTAAEMAIFIAARVASVPLNRTLTDEVVPYTKVNKKLKPSERVLAKEKGTLVFIQNGDFVEIDEAVNTLTNPPAGETKEFSKLRIHNAMDQITKDLEAFGEQYKKELSNTDIAREIYAATVENSYLKGMASREVVQPGYFYRPDPNYHGKDAVFNPQIDEAFFFADLTPVDSMERIYQKIGVSF